MFDSLISVLHVRDLNGLALLDIFLLAFLIYRFLLIVRGTRAQRAMAGVLFVVLVHFTTGPGLFHLRAIHNVLGYLLLYIPFAIIVLFSPRFWRND